MRESGAEPIVADGLDRPAVMSAVMRSEPDVVIHQMTASPASRVSGSSTPSLAPTSRLRTEGTDNILEAAARRAPAGRSPRATASGTTRAPTTG